MFIRKAARAIIDDIKNNTHNWRLPEGEHRFTNGKVEIWVANEIYGLGIFENGKIEKIFNYFERRSIYKAYKKNHKSKKLSLQEKIKKPSY